VVRRSPIFRQGFKSNSHKTEWGHNLSVEVAEAYILAKQMDQELKGKKVNGATLKGTQKFQDLGFINMYSSDFDALSGGKIESVISRGNTIKANLNNGLNLILAPEYGGKILYHPKNSKVPSKYHLIVSLEDKTAFTVTLTGMGIIQVFNHNDLANSYVYRRDFSQAANPVDHSFNATEFAQQLGNRKVNIKTVLVGKEAAVVGLGNSMFQDVIFRAAIHPKRKAADLNDSEKQSLYGAIKHVLSERIRLGGKTQFVDFYGKAGTYEPAMGPNMKNKPCLACGAEVEKMSLGGGQIYFCPSCQK
jgi:formamidopyrimidine-DNA glycosylase